MPETKTYLNVPYAEKDAAKALGARWDAAAKKWYVPTNLDSNLFAKWHIEDGMTPANKLKSAKKVDSAVSSGVFTAPGIPNFVAYDGDEPPWN